MIDALLTRLKDGIEIRQTLSKIRQAIKDEEAFSDHVGSDKSFNPSASKRGRQDQKEHRPFNGRSGNG